VESNGMFESMNAHSNASPGGETEARTSAAGADSTSDDTASAGSMETDSKSVYVACKPLVAQLALEKG